MLALLLSLAACHDDESAQAGAAVGPDAAPSVVATPEPTLESAPTAAPSPPAEPSPTAEPGPTEEPDNTPVVMTGEGWKITERTIGEIVDFIEATHDLDYRAPVRIQPSDDIGTDILGQHESFPEADWYVLELLGITDPEFDRKTVNEFRIQRVRGVCCRTDDDGTTVATVEPQATRLETELIIVHELTHALHSQHPELHERRSGSDEFPSPSSAAREGVPQLIALAWLDQAPADQRAIVVQELPVVTDELAGEIGIGPARLLNFAYETAPDAFASIYAERGAAGLTDWLSNPPVTTEQVLFPERWVDAAGDVGDSQVGVRAPELPTGADSRRQGTLGAALVLYALVDEIGEPAALDLASNWTGGTWTLYRPIGGEPVCLAARVAMDTALAAETLARHLGQVLASDANVETQETVLGDVTVVRLETCGRTI